MLPTFDAYVLAAVCAELRATILGARVQKVQQPSMTDVVLSFFGPHGAHRLLISADPQAPRIHLTQIKRENPKNAPGFCQVARKDLDGTWLEEIVQVPHERLCTLRFSEGLLVAELMGRNANLFLLDAQRRIRGTLRPDLGVRGSKYGQAYIEPPGLGEGVRLGAFAEAEAALRDLSTLPFSPHSVSDEQGNTVGVWAFEPRTVRVGLRHARESISVALDTFYSLQSERSDEASRAQRLKKSLERESAFRVKALADARRTLEESASADHHEQSGQLLLAHLGAFQKGQTSVALDDWFQGGTRTVSLDAQKTPQENAEGYFARARKARDAAEWADGRIADLEDELAELARLATLDDLDDLEEALSELVGAERVSPVAREPGKRAFDGHRVRKFDLDGWTLFVGENAEANDFLLRRIAAPSDLWMHVRGAAGSHGVLRTVGHPLRVPEPVVRKAAALVAARSKWEKHAGLVPVDIVERRHVRRPRSAGPGKVFYTRARTLDVIPASEQR
jgi:predicted ribosome quality control (RQC) complex YloA/Tae2 family protein